MLAIDGAQIVLMNAGIGATLAQDTGLIIQQTLFIQGMKHIQHLTKLQSVLLLQPLKLGGGPKQLMFVQGMIKGIAVASTETVAVEPASFCPDRGVPILVDAVGTAGFEA